MFVISNLIQSFIAIILLLISLTVRVLVDPLAFIARCMYACFFEVSAKKFYAGKTILITGASSGIGESLALKAAKLGANVILAGRREDRLKLVYEACKDVSSSDSQVFMTWIIDLEKCDQLEANFKAILGEMAAKKLSGVDILINNAGVSTRGSNLELTIDTLTKVMSTNFLGPATLSQIVAKDMISRNIEGIIIVNSSVQGKLAIPNRAAYAASKHALQGYFDSFRMEMEPYGIHTMVVSPGYVATQLSINAVCGNGDKYNKLDDTTKNGMSPDTLSEIIFSLATSKSNKDVTVADQKTNAAILGRQLFPELVWKFLKNKK